MEDSSRSPFAVVRVAWPSSSISVYRRFERGRAVHFNATQVGRSSRSISDKG